MSPETSERLTATHPHHVWAIAFQFDETSDGRRLKLANIVDEHTREALAMRVGRTCIADELVEVIDDLVADRGAPEHLRMDSTAPSSCVAAEGLVPSGRHRDHLHRAGSGWEHPYVASFNGRSRDELLNEEFGSLLEAKVIARVANPVQHLQATWLSRWAHPTEYAINWTTQPNQCSHACGSLKGGR